MSLVNINKGFSIKDPSTYLSMLKDIRRWDYIDTIKTDRGKLIGYSSNESNYIDTIKTDSGCLFGHIESDDDYYYLWLKDNFLFMGTVLQQISSIKPLELSKSELQYVKGLFVKVKLKK